MTYSSSFVECISDIVHGMNISAAATVINSSVKVSGNSLSLDESKFANSDLNVVVSVKVHLRALVVLSWYFVSERATNHVAQNCLGCER